MPGFWKKPAVSRLLSRLRSKRASSTLVVETGFPTSLADLVVKQRARLRSRKPPSPPPAPQPPPIGCTTASAAVAVEVRCIAPTAPLETGTTRWFGFLAAMLLVVVLMVIGWRGVVSGITISAFVLLMFDFLGFRVLESVCPTRSEGLDLVERELVSPVREVGVEEESELLQNCEGSVLERRDLAVVGGDESMICLGSHCLKKKKKLWKRFLPKKMRRRRSGSGSAREEIETDSCSRSQIVSEYEQDELSIEQEGQIDEEVLNEEACSEVSCRDRVNLVDMEGNDTGKTNLWSFRQIILIAVLLLGLLGGRAMALVVTIGWFLATRSVEVLGRKLKAYRRQQFL